MSSHLKANVGFSGSGRFGRDPLKVGVRGMGVNLWGASPLYVNPVNVLNILIKILADGKGVSARRGLEEARVQSYEPTNRNSI